MAKALKKRVSRVSTEFLNGVHIPKRGRNPMVVGKKDPQYPHECLQSSSFAKRTCGNLAKMPKFRIKKTFGEVVNGRGLEFPVDDLEVVDSSLWALSSDGVPLAVFLKGGLNWPLKCVDIAEIGVKAIEKFVSAYPPRPPKSTDVRYKDQEYVVGTGLHVLAFWHGIGHEREQAVISRDIRDTATHENAVVTLLNEFTPVTQAIGALLEVVDRKSYARYCDRFKAAADSSAAKVLRTTSRNCFLGMALLTNLQCDRHRDQLDSLDGWGAHTAFGDFDSAYFEVPQVGKKFNLMPNDVLFMRSSILQHSVSSWDKSKYRFGCVLFSHGSVLNEC
jgi:hypothetical protein